MDLNLVHAIIAIVGALGTWNMFIEKRMHGMYTQLKEKMEDKDRVHQVVQQDLKEHIVSLREQNRRLEEKIDMLLLRLNIRVNNHGSNP